MNSLDMNYECIDNRLQNNCNEYLAPNIENQFWYSSTFLPLNNCQYIQNTNSQQLLESAIHKWRIDSDLKPDLRYESKESLKRSHYSSNTSEDYGQRKRSRYHDSHSLQLKRKYFEFNSSKPSFECKCCHSLSYSFLDFKNHLKGRRHALSLNSVERKRLSQTSFSNSLERNLNKTHEPVVGLDFIQEVDNKYSTETIFDCKLCECYHLKPSSAFQHILGFKHRLNFIKLIDSHEAKSLMDNENRPRQTGTDSEIARSLAKKFERLYGRGNCKFIKRDYKKRHSADTRSVNRSLERSPNLGHKSVIMNESAANSSSKNESKSELIDENRNLDEALETLKAIRQLCDKTLEFYSIKHHLSANSETETNNSKSNQLNGKVEEFNSELVSALINSGVNSVINFQLDSKNLSNQTPNACN